MHNTSHTGSKDRQDTEDQKRDFGITIAAATVAIAEFAIYLASSYWPEVLWRNSLAATALLIPVLVFVASLIAAVCIQGRSSVQESSVALMLTLAIYAIVQGFSYYAATGAARQAGRAAASWPLLVSQDYRHVTKWTTNNTLSSPFGVLATVVQNGTFLLTLNSNRDETDLLSPDGQNQPAVSDFYLQADVQYVVGPPDGGCVLVFGETKSEHWFGFKLGYNTYSLTRDVGGLLPHESIIGPYTSSAIRQNASNDLGVLRQGSDLKLFINDNLVEDLPDFSVPAGKIWIAPQAATTRDYVKCAYTHVTLRGVKS